MKPSNELFDLIKSLNKSEKRFFKLSSSLQSGDKNYLKIFDYIDAHNIYDEEELRAHFKNERFIKHLPSEKNHLYKLILKSLRGYYADNSVNSILKEEIKNVEILYKKALFKECRKFLRRAKVMAHEHEKFYYWFELISWEKSLIEEDYEQGIFTENLDLLIKEESEVVEKLRNLAEYQMIYSRINYIFRSGGFATKPEDLASVDEIANHHLIIGKNTALSSRAASICYYIQGLCNATKRDFETAIIKFNRTKDILDKNLNLKPDLSKRYVKTIHNLILCHLNRKEFDLAQHYINILHDLSDTKGFASFDIKVKIFTTVYTSQIALSYSTGNFQVSLPMVEEMIQGIEDYGDKLPKEQIVLFNYHIAYVFFGSGLYRDALKWINKIINDNEQELRQDIYGYARIFNLIVHFEMENYDLLEYLFKSTSRMIKKNGRTEKVEMAIITLLKKLIKQSEKQRIETLKLFQIELNELLEIESQNAILQYFNISAWVKSKIENITFEVAMKSIL